jgi:hypothetical protein
MAVLPPTPAGRRLEGELVWVNRTLTYRLRFDFNVMADFEEQTGGRDIMSALSPADGAAPSMVDLRRIFWLCFAAYHPEVDLREAGRLYSADTTVLEQLLRQCMPEPAPMDGSAPAAESGGEPGNAQAVRAA